MAENAEQNQASDILKAALDEAFVIPPPRETLKAEVDTEATLPPANEDVPPPPTDLASSSASTSAPLDESWKQEYEEHVQTWRAQSAEQREKAEKERSKWEAIRANEALNRKVAESEAPSLASSQAGWEQVGHALPETVAPAAPSNLSANQASTTKPTSARASSQPGTSTEEKWEDVPSLESSYPSLSFPENTDTPPPPPVDPPPPNPPVSVTLAIFDASLSKRTRIIAFASSLAVNLLLPFVNGVMLGFGEIFAKDIVMGWLGWKGPGASIAGVGLGRSGLSPRELRQKQGGFK